MIQHPHQIPNFFKNSQLPNISPIRMLHRLSRLINILIRTSNREFSICSYTPNSNVLLVNIPLGRHNSMNLLNNISRNVRLNEPSIPIYLIINKANKQSVILDRVIVNHNLFKLDAYLHPTVISRICPIPVPYFPQCMIIKSRPIIFFHILESYFLTSSIFPTIYFLL